MKSDRRANYGTGKRAREIEIPKDVHITPRMYQKLTEKIAGKPEERILSYLNAAVFAAGAVFGGELGALCFGCVQLIRILLRRSGGIRI